MTRTLRSAFAPIAVLAGLALAACGPSYTVQSQTLSVSEQDYGTADYFCQTLELGQSMIVLTDLPLCVDLHAMGATNDSVFHGIGGEANLRLIVPTMNLVKLPSPDNKFTVGPSDCQNITATNPQAVAYFDHQSPDTSGYDVSVQADSGTITVIYPTSTHELTGSFDLTFGTDHITGSFDATLCSAITVGTGE